MSGGIWDGVTRSATLQEWARTLRQRLADRARAYDWASVLALLAEHGSLVNSTRPDGRSWYAPLHQAAHGGASVEIVERLVALGAWRTLRAADGQRPIDIAEQRGQTHLLAILTPAFERDIPLATLGSLQERFHAIINGRAEHLVREHALRLPELEVMLEMRVPRLWFAVPGMYGGFRFWLDQVAGNHVLISESWSRVVGGSGQRHLISPHGSLLLDEGFV